MADTSHDGDIKMTDAESPPDPAPLSGDVGVQGAATEDDGLAMSMPAETEMASDEDEDGDDDEDPLGDLEAAVERSGSPEAVQTDPRYASSRRCGPSFNADTYTFNWNSFESAQKGPVETRVAAPNDDFQAIRRDPKPWVLEILKAFDMSRNHACPRPASSKLNDEQWLRWMAEYQESVERDMFNQQALAEHQAWKFLEAIINLHEHGLATTVHKDLKRRPEIPAPHGTCSDRIRRAIAYITGYAILTWDVINDVKLGVLAAAPELALQRKVMNKNNNDGKRAKKGKQAGDGPVAGGPNRGARARNGISQPPHYPVRQTPYPPGEVAASSSYPSPYCPPPPVLPPLQPAQKQLPSIHELLGKSHVRTDELGPHLPPLQSQSLQGPMQFGNFHSNDQYSQQSNSRASQQRAKIEPNLTPAGNANLPHRAGPERSNRSPPRWTPRGVPRPGPRQPEFELETFWTRHTSRKSPSPSPPTQLPPTLSSLFQQARARARAHNRESASSQSLGLTPNRPPLHSTAIRHPAPLRPLAPRMPAPPHHFTRLHPIPLSTFPRYLPNMHATTTRPSRRIRRDRPSNFTAISAVDVEKENEEEAEAAPEAEDVEEEVQIKEEGMDPGRDE